METCKQCGTELTFMNKTMCVKCGVLICDDCSITNKYKCNKCADKQKLKIPDVIRRSSIEDYKSCPYYFKLHIIDGNEPKQNVLARLGSDLHDMYEQIQRNQIALQDIESHSKKIIEDILTTYPEEERERLESRTEVCNKSFEKLLPTLINTPIAFEERIKFSIGEDLPKVTIAYDRLEKDENGDLHIIDWKTGKVMSGKKLTTDLQPALYLKAVEQQYGVMPKSFRLVYLSDVDKSGMYKERIFNSIDGNKFVCKVGNKEYIQDIQEQIKVVQGLFAKIKQGKFSIPEKPDYFKCKMCSFREDGLCAGVGVEEWNQVNGERARYGW